MSNNEYEIALAVSDPAERAEALVPLLDERAPGPAMLRRILRDPYDVIRADVLDYLIVNKIKLDEEDVIDLAREEISPIVRGRARFYFSLVGLDRSFGAISERTFSNVSEYDEVWIASSNYIRKPTLFTYMRLSSFIFSDSYDLSGTALDLLYGFAQGSHRRLLITMLLIVIDHEDELRINLARVQAIIAALRDETGQKVDISPNTTRGRT